MSDPLDLIAEARRRQEKAESNCSYWRENAEHQRKRCRLLIDMMRRRPLDTPTMHPGGIADWNQLERMVDDFAKVISDPYALHPDDDDEFAGPTHETAKMIMAHRIQDMIGRAVAAIEKEGGKG